MQIIVGRSGTKVEVDEEDYKRITAEKYYFCNSGHGYIVLKKYLGWKDGRSKYKEVYLHRYIMNPPKGYQVDHKNQNKLDNRRSNLRVCTGAQNGQNKRQFSGKYKGVHQDKKSGRWLAQITKDYKCHHIGSFRTPESAALAYNKRALELHGRFAFLNRVEEVAPDVQ